MKLHQCVQYTAEWWEVRNAMPTASCFDQIITPAKAQPSSSQDGYIAELLADAIQASPPFFSSRGTGRPMTEDQKRGLDLEPQARADYGAFIRKRQGLGVQMVGFCESDCGRYGGSPDGLVGDEGVLELKCPHLKTQVAYLLKGTLPLEYKVQCHGHLLVTGRKWCDFYSYHPDTPALWVRVTPDEFTKKLELELEAFLKRYHAAAIQLGLILEQGRVRRAA